MKFLLYSILLIAATNCGGSQPSEPVATKPEPVIQEEQVDILVGKLGLEDLQKAPFSAWFDPMYKSYKPNDEALQTIKENINDYEIVMFMGTWCADSQREVPKLYKVLELSNYDLNKMEVRAVREDKTLPDDRQKEYDITYVPTIIFYKDGEEAGRFVEYPQEDFEDDIAKIVSGEEYKHSYE
ncbi:TlpA family protein disulfide reductase [Salinimicrobium sp. HB62]|uniref:TlpA family protein disulfide reductase n=1 Tax=Salinimicrobium sp. HB62 TaxID=3077781 RepID=UPI002D7A0DFF|nr:thioredoxin family protein [Salinimicrobium sp. HB62]